MEQNADEGAANRAETGTGKDPEARAAAKQARRDARAADPQRFGTKSQRLERKQLAVAAHRRTREERAAQRAAARSALDAQRVAIQAERAAGQAERAAILEAKALARAKKLHDHKTPRAALPPEATTLPQLADWAGFGDHEASTDGRIIVGRDGWVFLARDSNQVLKQHTGELLFDHDQLEGWRRTLEARYEWVSERGAGFLFVVPPNPHSVFPEKLPADAQMGATRPVLQLLAHLAAAGSRVPVLYPLDELLAVKDTDLIYPTTDSHWSALGAFVAYRAMLDRLPPGIERRTLERDEIQFEEAYFPGGLGMKLEPPVASTQLVARVRSPSAILVEDNCVRRGGRVIRFESAAAPDVSCVVFGDSYSYAMLRYLSETFRRFLFVHLPTLDRRVVEEARADVVICSCNERFLIRVPEDDSGPSAERVAAEKQAAGLVLSAAHAAKESLKLLWP